MKQNEKAVLVASVLGPILIMAMLGWVSWSFNARMTIERQMSDKFNAETYATKTFCEKSHEEINRKIDTVINEVGGIRNEVASVKNDVSMIKGELTASPAVRMKAHD